MRRLSAELLHGATKGSKSLEQCKSAFAVRRVGVTYHISGSKFNTTATGRPSRLWRVELVQGVLFAHPMAI
jgi:hypothetical protein